MQKLKLASMRFIQIFEFPEGWGITLVILLIDAIWKANTWLSPPLLSHVIFLPIIAFIVVKFLFEITFSAESGIKAPRWFLSISTRFFFGAEYFFLFLCAGFAFAYLSYLMCTLDFPLVDQQLDDIDKLMGFHWLSWYEWAKDISILNVAYHCLGYEILLFWVYCSIFLLKDRMNENFWILLITLLITVPLSGIFPGFGPFYFYKHLPYIKLLDADIYDSFVHVNLIRAGQAPNLIHGFKGIILFPSFHSSCAVIYAYCFRGLGVVGFTMLWLNIFMLASTPFFGGHYLIDVLAGIIIAIFAIIIVRACKR